MKIQYDDGPDTIRTDEGDIARGVPFEATDALAEKLLAYETCKFRTVEETATRRKKKEVDNATV